LHTIASKTKDLFMDLTDIIYSPETSSESVESGVKSFGSPVKGTAPKRFSGSRLRSRKRTEYCGFSVRRALDSGNSIWYRSDCATYSAQNVM